MPPKIQKIKILIEKEYQEEVKIKLKKIYSEEIEVQWYPFRGYGRKIYTPIVDIAVGPFAIDDRYEVEYTCILGRTKIFIESLIDKHNQNFKNLKDQTTFELINNFNENARCLFCIEIEDTGGRKHCLGNLVNASALGRIGLLVARSEEVLRVFIRQRVYLRHLMSLGKNSFKTNNTLVLSEDQFNDCLNQLTEPIKD